MSNFEELVKDRDNWTLDSDQRLFEKVKNMSYNIFKATQTIHESVEDISQVLKTA